MIVRPFKIGMHSIGGGEPYFIAEMGGAHNNSRERVNEFIELAKEAGCHALKTQFYRAMDLVDSALDRAGFERALLVQPDPLIIRYTRERCLSSGIEFLCTPHDDYGLAFLDEMGVNAYKVGSGEYLNLPFIERIARKQKPMIVSLGMHSIQDALDMKRIIGRYTYEVAFLYCVTAYPATPDLIHPPKVSLLRNYLQCPIGFSDHSKGVTAAVMSIAHGACIIERHVDLPNNTQAGRDREVSEIGKTMSSLYFDSCRLAYTYMRGNPDVKPSDLQAGWAVKSITSRILIKKGETITEESIRVVRPGGGHPGRDMPDFVGKVARDDIPPHTHLRTEMVE